MDNNTSITYDKVRADATTIQECAKTMDNIFTEFGNSMKRVGAEDVFVGSASESLGTRFASLRKKFDDYVLLVNEFAKMIHGAADTTETMEKGLAAKADELAG